MKHVWINQISPIIYSLPAKQYCAPFGLHTFFINHVVIRFELSILMGGKSTKQTGTYYGHDNDPSYS